MNQSDKRCTILCVAMELIALNGFHGAPTSLIAARANVGIGTIYRYFTSKEAMIYELHSDLEKRFCAALMQEYPSGQPFRERFIHVGRNFVRYFLASSIEFRFWEQFHNSPYGVTYLREQIFGEMDHGILVKLLEEGQKEQIIKSLPNLVLTALIFGPLLCAVHDHILGFSELDEQMIDHTLDACWDAVRL